jgi:hypothetical protein
MQMPCGHLQGWRLRYQKTLKEFKLEAMRNKQLLLSLMILFLSALRMEAATLTVKAGGGGNFTSIQACASAMTAGDTCVVYAGTYNEVPTLTAGTPGNYNTVTVNTGDTVNVFGFVMASHTKLNGFFISNPSSPANAPCVSVPPGITDAYITNNSLHACGGGGGTEYASLVGVRNGATGSSFIFVQNNTITHGCSAPGVNDVCESISIGGGDHWLIEGNDLSHNDDTIEFYASFIIARNNTIHDIVGSECSTGGHGSNCHADQFESEPNTSVTAPSTHNMFEGNTVKNAAGQVHGGLMQGDACGGQCLHTIFRFNLYYNLGGYYMLNDLPSFDYVKTYNETFSGGGPNDLSGNFNGAAPGTSSMINILMYQFANSTPGSYFYGSPTAHNNLINPSTSPFVNANSDWHLASGSAAIGAGGSLTTTVGSGSSSTTLKVADAYYFQDGWGFPAGTGLGQVSPDWIRIGASATAQISSINYGSGVITLASPVSWNNGDPVYLYKNSSGTIVLTGATPDIGAFPSGLSSRPVSNSPQPPTNIQAVVQ